MMVDGYNTNNGGVQMDICYDYLSYNCTKPYNYEKDKSPDKSDFDIEGHIIKDSISNISEENGVATVYTEKQINYIKKFFKLIWFPDDCCVVENKTGIIK